MRKAICTPNEAECECECEINRKQRRIQDFPDGGGFQPQREVGGGHQPIIWPNLAQNCMKMKKIGPGTSKILQQWGKLGFSEKAHSFCCHNYLGGIIVEIFFKFLANNTVCINKAFMSAG